MTPFSKAQEEILSPEPGSIGKSLMMNGQLKDFSSDLDKFVNDFTSEMRESFSLTLQQTLFDQQSGKTYLLKYQNLSSYEEPLLDISGVKAAFTIAFPDFDIKLSGLKMNIKFLYTLIDNSTGNQILQGDAFYQVGNMIMEYANKQSIEDASFKLEQTKVTVANPTLMIKVNDSCICSYMTEFLSFQITSSLNMNSEDIPSEKSIQQKRQMFEIPKEVASSLQGKQGELQNMIKNAEQSKIVLANAIQEHSSQVSSIMQSIQSLKLPIGRSLNAIKDDLRVLETREEENAENNFYYLIESAYQYRMETGLEDVQQTSINKEIDIFDTMDEIKKQVQEKSNVQKANTIGEHKNKKNIKEQSINEVPNHLQKVNTIVEKTQDEIFNEKWSKNIQSSFVQAKKDLESGKLNWNKISADKLKNIENKVSWETKLKENINNNVNIKQLEKAYIKTENDLSKIADQTYSRVSQLLKGKFP